MFPVYKCYLYHLICNTMLHLQAVDTELMRVTLVDQ